MDPVEKPEPEPETTSQTAPMADVDPALYEAEEAAFAVVAEEQGDAPLAAASHPELDAIKEAILEAGDEADEDEPLDDLDDDFDDELYDEEEAALEAFAEDDGEFDAPAAPPAPQTGLQHPAALALWVATAGVVLPLTAAIAGLSLALALTRPRAA